MSRLRTRLLPVFAVLLAMPAPAFADSDPTAPPGNWTLTGSATAASQYRYRGISQSDNRPVIQGTITVTHASGFYASVWASSTAVGDSPIATGATELDIYGGYTHALGQTGILFDGGLYGYIFAGAPRADFYEVYGALSETLGPVTGKIGSAIAPTQQTLDYSLASRSRTNLYVYGEVSGAVPNTPISLHSHLAHTGGGIDYAHPYVDYALGATAKWKHLALDLSIVGTTISRADLINAGQVRDGAGGVDALKLDAYYRQGKPVGVISLTASF